MPWSLAVIDSKVATSGTALITRITYSRTAKLTPGAEQMTTIFNFNEQVVERSATVASILALKNSDQRMIEVSAIDAEDAAAAEAAGIELLITMPEFIPAVRAGSSKAFLTATIDFERPNMTEDEMLHAATECMLAGADAVVTSRRTDSVKRLTDECIPVMGHVGFVPRRSTFFGGIRGVGKTAAEATAIWDEIRRLEDAGAFSVECELISEPMMAEMTKRTSIAAIGLGSGDSCDIFASYSTDIYGHGEHIPRHARSYADLNALYEKIRSEKFRALAEFRADVDSGSYPNASESIRGDEAEVEQFVDMLERGS